MRNQIRTDDLVTLELLEETGIKHFCQLAHALEPHLILLKQLLHRWKVILVHPKPCFHLIDGLHALIRLEDKVVRSHAKRDLLDALVQIQQH